MKRLLVILGPTATGKTDLALKLAKEFNGELVSCDSRQVYKGLDIGTGKLPKVITLTPPVTPRRCQAKLKLGQGELNIKRENGYWEIERIKVWMYDVADPKVQFTVKDYVDQSEKVIEGIGKRGKLPIVVGGTGLYLRALLEGLPNLMIPVDRKLRGELQKLTLEELQNKLQSLFPARWKKLNKSDRQNPRRLLRSMELFHMYGFTDACRKAWSLNKSFKILKIGLVAPREILKKRIFDRLLARLDQGMIEEAKRLSFKGVSFTRMKELGLEYRMLADLLERKINKNEFIEKLAIKIGQYAKRQMTWFKKDKNVNWFDITNQDWGKEVEKLVGPWYYTKDDQEN